MEKYLKKVDEEGLTLAGAAEALVSETPDDEEIGVSELMLKDPAAQKMLARAEKLGTAGRNIEFMKEIVKAARKKYSDPVDLDMLGAIGAVMMDLGFTPEATWAIMAITRSFAAGAHYIEEVEGGRYTRMGEELTPKEDYIGPEDRSVPPLAERGKTARSALKTTTKEWKERFEEMKKVPGSGFAIVEEVKDPSKKSGIKKVGKL
jgi:hypothetical protein